MQTVIVALPLATQGLKRSNQAVIIALLGGNGNRRNVRPLAHTVVGVEHTGEGFKPALEALGFGNGYDLTKTGYSQKELTAMLEQTRIRPEDFSQEFSLPSRDTVLAHTMHVTLHREQIRIIKAAISAATRDGEGETYGNTDKNGNGLAKVVKEWLAANTSSAESEDL